MSEVVNEIDSDKAKKDENNEESAGYLSMLVFSAAVVLLGGFVYLK